MKIAAVFSAVTRSWLRSRSGLFFSFLFPVVLLLLLGSVYGSGSPSGEEGVTYYLPGLTAAFIMTNGVIGLTNTGSELRRNGVLKRLSTTPLTKLEWILGNVLSQTVLAVALAMVMLVLGVLLYHAALLINPYSAAILVLGSLLFSGVGLSLAGLVRDPEAASGLGNLIAFPMMLLSGTFWPLAAMPSYLQAVARVLPLTYFADGLRSSLTTADFASATLDITVVASFALALVLLGARYTTWKEG